MAAPLTQAADMDLYRPSANEDGSTDASAVPPALSATEEDQGIPLNPDAKALFAKCPWLRKVPVFNKASVAYGPKTTVSLGVTYLMCKGVADQLIKGTMLAMLVTRFGVDATRYQRLRPMASLGWSIKAFTAMFSDAFAFLGYTKRHYITGSAVLGGVFALAYGFLPVNPSSADIGGAFIFLTSFFKANFDILAEGHYSRLMRKIPSAGSSLVTWIWVLILIGSTVASAMYGPLSDLGKPQICVFVAAALQLVTAVFPIFNWYGEKKNRVERAEDARQNYLDAVHEHQRLIERERAEAAKHHRNGNGSTTDEENEAGVVATAGLVVGENKDLHPELGEDQCVARADVLADDLLCRHNAEGQLVEIDHEAAAEEAAMNAPQPVPCCCGAFEMNKEVVTRDWRVFAYCAIMTVCVLAMMVSNILAPRLGIIIVAACCSTICCGLSFWALPMTIAKANVFGFLHMVIYLNIGPLDNFYIASPECLPDGPHFSFTFYQTVGSIIGSAAGMLGTVGFNYIFSKRSYRVTFMVTATVQILASLFDIIMVKRWNVAIGIPDHAMYICGDAIIYQVCYMLNWMPMVILLSRLCPRGSESVVYALVAGFANLGSSTSSVVTSILMEYVWPIKSTVPCNFDNLVWLIIVGHLCTPLLIFPLTLLLPKARCCDDLDVDGKAIRREIKAEKKSKKHHAKDADKNGSNGKSAGFVEAEVEPFADDTSRGRNPA